MEKNKVRMLIKMENEEHKAVSAIKFISYKDNTFSVKWRVE